MAEREVSSPVVVEEATQKREEARQAPTIFPCADGIRAIGATMIVMHHTGNATNTVTDTFTGQMLARVEVALAILFMVSGFLIFRPFAGRYLAGRTDDIRTYFKKRIARIYPGYWFALIAVWFFFGTWNAQDRRNPVDFLAYATLAYTYFHRYALAPLQQAWTLNIELAFYFFIPVFVFCLRRFGRRASTPLDRLKVQLVGLGVVFVLSQMWVFWAVTGPKDDMEFRLQWLPGYLGTIAFGMLLAVLSCAYEQRILRPAQWLESRRMPAVSWTLAWGMFVGLSASKVLPPNRFDYSGKQWVFVQFFDIAFAVLLLLPAVFGKQDDGRIRTFLRLRPIAFVGVVSYGIYLWHLAWTAKYFSWFHPTHANYFVVLAWTMVLSTVSGAVSFFFVERPLQRLGGSRAVNRLSAKGVSSVS
jgi:peptidoglycan/LPS O-acetylase OafA/YrhL